MSQRHALLLTDLVDSTALSAALGDAAMSALWATHDHLARELLRRWRGREIDKSDGFLLLFASVGDAANYALDYHRALRQLPGELKARAGLHVGPVTLRQTPPEDVGLGAKPLEVDGLSKSIAGRVMALALGGQTLLSADARAALTATTARIEARGHWRLKGLEQPLELFEIGDEDAPFRPPGESAKAYRVRCVDGLWLPVREVPHSLPAERDSFIGRQAPLHALAQLIDAGGRLLCVLGMGGMGKTRLAQRFGWTWLGDFSGGVWFCDLSAARDIDGIVHAVASGLNVPLGRADPIAQLGHALAGRGHCLVILDNFEQVAHCAEASVGQWLNRAPQVRFIVTTRQTLGIVGEQVLALDVMTAAEAADLFRQRAAATGYGHFDRAADEAAIEPLVELLDRLPLAIELAAARVPAMAPSVLLQRMGERFKLLSAGSGRLSRQATLHAAFDWSWELLAPPEKAALAQLSVFEGRITLAAAEAVLDLSAHDQAMTALDALQSLVQKSLLRRRPGSRFDLLDSVRDFAAEQLAAPGRYPGSGPQALAQAQRRHAEYFAGLGAKGATLEACAELYNLVAAVRHAAALGQPRTAVAALQGAWAALLLRGPFRLGVDLADLVRAMPGLELAAAAHVDWVAGRALRASGQVAQAALRFESALAAAVAVADRVCESQVRVHLGDLHLNAGRMDQAKAELDLALSLAGAARETLVECAARCSLGNLNERLGRLDQARQQHELALACAQQAGDRRWEGGCLGNLGMLLADQGRMNQARVQQEAALAIACELGDRQWEGNTRCNLGLLHHVQGDLDRARVELDRALALARELGHTRLECVVRCNLGITFAALQLPQAAQLHYESALALARDLGDRRSQGQCLGYLGALHARQGRFDDAHRSLDAGEQLLWAVSDRLSLGLLLCHRAECDHLSGSPGAALEALAAASALAHEIGVKAESELGLALDHVRSVMNGLSAQAQAPASASASAPGTEPAARSTTA